MHSEKSNSIPRNPTFGDKLRRLLISQEGVLFVIMLVSVLFPGDAYGQIPDRRQPLAARPLHDRGRFDRNSHDLYHHHRRH